MEKNIAWRPLLDSNLAKTSLVSSLLSFMFFGGAGMIALAFEDVFTSPLAPWILPLLFTLGLVLWIAGLVSGVLALLRNTPRKGLAIAGLILSLLMAPGYSRFILDGFHL